MLKTQIEKEIKVNRSILAFTPRQVLLSSKRTPSTTMKLDESNEKTLILNAEQKSRLFHSIAQYLQRSGFSKTLKKFISETKIKKDELTDSSFDLEEMFIKFSQVRNGISKNSNGDELQELDGKKKKKKTDKSEGDKPIDSKNTEENSTRDNDTMSTDVKSKEKKRKKKKQSNLDSEAVTDNAEATQEKSTVVVSTEEKEITNSEIDKDNKNKKKRKKNKLSFDPVPDEEKQNKSDSGKGDFKTPKEDVTNNHYKSSKKRKRVASEEDASKPSDKEQVEVSEHVKTEESKRRKTESSKEPDAVNSSSRIEEKTSKEANGELSSSVAHKMSTKQIEGLSNGIVEENGEKSSMKKTKKQQNGSSEPKSVKHFQRIKVEDVVFSDERLKDNSYWAKDGAEIGYGAKAQDVLGQVRGRDFRHEKTKKKRGSYRGGQIDLQSHSIKFNNSDDD